MPTPDKQTISEATGAAQAPILYILDRPPDRQLWIRITDDRQSIVLRMFVRSPDAAAADNFAAEGRGIVVGAADLGELRSLLSLAALDLER